MTERLEIGPVGSPKTVLDTSDLFMLDGAKEHTAMADFEAEIPYDRSARNLISDPVRIYPSGSDTPIFRGYLRKIDWDQSQGVTRLTGPGIAQDLKDDAIEVTFSRISYEDAIRQIWDHYTNFNFTVYPADTTVRASDKPIIAVPSQDNFADLFTPSATDPLGIKDFDSDGDDELGLLQSCFHAEDTALGGKEVTDSEASEGTAVNAVRTGDDGREDVVPVYDIPEGSVGGAVRLRAPDDPDNDGFFETPNVRFTLEGNQIEEFIKNAELVDDNYQWFTEDSVGISGGLTAGTNAELKYEVLEETDDFARVYVDLMVLYDSRFTYNFDNSVDANNHLAGPELKPNAFQATFAQQTVPFNVIGINIDSSWNDLSGPQQISTSADVGSTWNTHSNTGTTKDDYPNNTGTKVDVRATFSRFGDSAGSTPTDGTKGQYIDKWTTAYDGNDLPVIDQRTFQGTPFNVLVEAHRNGGYRFAIDHSATDANGNLIKNVESFQSGTQTKTNDFDILNRNPTLSRFEYANRVTIYGREKSNGTRPKVTVESTSEVNDEGVEPFVEVKPELDTLNGVKGAARAILRQKVQAKKQKGTLDVMPTDTLPGYDYPVDWFDDGDAVDSALERVRFSLSGQSLNGTLKFEVDDDTTATVVDQGFELTSAKQSIKG